VTVGQLRGEGAAALCRLDRRLLLDALGEPVFLCDADSGRVLDANADGWALLGGRHEPGLEPRLSDFSAVDAGYTAARAKHHLQAALAVGSERFGWVCRRANGSSFSAEVRAVPADPSGAGLERGLVVVVVRDTSAEQEAREALRVAEERFVGMVRNLPRSAIMLCDRDLRIVLVDGPEIRTAGYEKATMEGQLVAEVLTPVVAEITDRNMRRALGGEVVSTEAPVGDLWYSCCYLPIRTEAGDIGYAMVVATNVTEERRALEKLRSSEERLARIVETAPDPMSILREDDSVITYVNPAFETTFGWASADIVGRATTEVGLWDDSSQRLAVLQEFRQKRRVDSQLIGARARSGKLVEGLLSLRAIEVGGIACILTSFRDVSELRSAQVALAASEARQRALADATFEGIAITHDGVVVDANEQLAALFAAPREALLGRELDALLVPATPARARARATPGSEGASERQAIRADGSMFPIEARSRDVVLDGRAVRVTAVRDMTERARAEAERTHLLAELRARNSEMEQFAYTVSHDLKSPLVTITGFLGAIEHDLRDGRHERVASDIRRIRSAAGKMSTLLDDLLELSRVGRVGGPLTPVPLGELAREAAELVAGALDAGHVQLEIAADLPVVYGDRGRLLQLVQNLFDNAAKYTAAKYTAAKYVAAEHARGAQPPHIELGWREQGEHWLLFVRDNGIGIPPEYAERIFGLFEKLDAKSPGTGIGLALARRIIEFHGGRIWVESDGHSGSTFYFTLPRQPVAAGARRAETGVK
jgi:PAS domain S-box-containing protein